MKIGIDLGGTNLRAGLVGPKGEVTERARVATPAGDGPERVVEIMASLCQKLGKFDSVGIGAPGLIDHARGIVRTSPNLPHWNEVPLAELLSSKLGVPVKVANDVNAIAWGEFLFGAGVGFRDILVITLGTGLGGALILNGSLHLGKDQTAGEIGHFTLIPGGHPCPCGNKGCLEQYVAKEAIVRRARSMKPEIVDVDPEIVAKRAHDGEEWAKAVYEGVAQNLGQVLGGMIQVLNLERIVVGGQIAKAGTVLFSPLRTATSEHVYPVLRDSYQIVKSELGNDAGIVGAAFL